MSREAVTSLAQQGWRCLAFAAGSVELTVPPPDAPDPALMLLPMPSRLVQVLRVPLAAGYASQNLGLKLGTANDREHLGRPHCTGA
jgi:hypothetical protein